MSKPYVALVGRPNTGKSTLFNKLAGRRISIVDDTPGVTRDRIISEATWQDANFYIIDTGGIEPDNEDIILVQMRRQAQIAMDMAEVIVYVADGREGITAADEEIAQMIRRSGTKTLLAVNKIDDHTISYLAYDFYKLSLGDPYPISAEHGLGVGDLLEGISEALGEEGKKEVEDDIAKIAVVGKPNVGKSTLVNALIGENRVIVSEVAGTTRDAIDTRFTYNDGQYLLIDTAGIKRKSKHYDNIEFYSSLRATKAIERCDICLFFIDATLGVTEFDTKIASLIQKANKAIVIVVNKWDLIEKATSTMNEMEASIRRVLYFLDYVPIIFLSAIDGKRVNKLMPKVDEVLENYSKRISTGLLNEVIANAVMMNPTPSKGGRHLKVFYASEVSVMPPTMILFVNDQTLTTRQYDRYLERKLRDAFDFTGSPIKIIYRERSRKEEE
jgi:GTP-binding protein